MWTFSFKTFVLSIVNIAFVSFSPYLRFFYQPGVLRFLKESFVKVLTKQKMIWKVKILCNKAPNRSQFWLQSSYFLPHFFTTDFRFSAFCFEVFFGFVIDFIRFTLAAWFLLWRGLSVRFHFITLYWSLRCLLPSSQMWWFSYQVENVI